MCIHIQIHKLDKLWQLGANYEIGVQNPVIAKLRTGTKLIILLCISQFLSGSCFLCNFRYTLVLNSHEVIQEALVKKGLNFAGRGAVYVDNTVWNPENRGMDRRDLSQQGLR